jgi:hypothetical protein
MIIRFGNHDTDLTPFLRAAVIWAVISLVVILIWAESATEALKPWAVLYVLGIFDLFFLVKTVAATLVLMSDQGAENRSAYAIQAFISGGLKLLCLGAIGFSLWKFQNAPNSGILLGIGTVAFIPLVGGWTWSQSQLKQS